MSDRLRKYGAMHGDRGKILVVDDTPDNLDLLNSLLTRKGFTVLTAHSGKAAIACVYQEWPELILLDICMPQMDGYAVCTALKADELTKNIPIIFISALDEVLDKIKAFKVGGIDYITKPFHGAEVVARIDTHLSIRRLQQQLETQNQRLQQEVRDREAAEPALQSANRELHRLANLDGLTQVANRRSFDTTLAKEWRRLSREENPLSLILCDVDCFKGFNDTYGHQAGDECLKQIARTITLTLKRPSDLLARYGGEEFVIVLPNTPETGAIHVAEEIRAAIHDRAIAHRSSSVRPIVTMSLGLATMIPQVECKPEYLLYAADRALYRAKVEGRDRVCIETVTLTAEP